MHYRKLLIKNLKKIASVVTLTAMSTTLQAAPLLFNAAGTLTEYASGTLTGSSVAFNVNGVIDPDQPPLYEELGFDYAYYELVGTSSGSLDTLENILFDTQGLELHNNLAVFDDDALAAGVANGTTVDLVSVVLSAEDIDNFYLLYVDFFYDSDSLLNDMLTDLSSNLFSTPALGTRAFMFKEDLTTFELSSIEGTPTVASLTSVPVPTAAWLFASGLLSLLACRRR